MHQDAIYAEKQNIPHISLNDILFSNDNNWFLIFVTCILFFLAFIVYHLLPTWITSTSPRSYQITEQDNKQINAVVIFPTKKNDNIIYSIFNLYQRPDYAISNILSTYAVKYISYNMTCFWLAKYLKVLFSFRSVDCPKTIFTRAGRWIERSAFGDYYFTGNVIWNINNVVYIGQEMPDIWFLVFVIFNDYFDINYLCGMLCILFHVTALNILQICI